MFGLWDHQFCLACDKQVSVEGAAYCSEACRLNDFEKTSTMTRTASSSACSPANSPDLMPTSYPWTTSTSPSTTRTAFYLSPAYDFSNAQPYGSTPSQQSFFGNYTFASSTNPSTETTRHTTQQLTPSSSHSSLCSMHSGSASSESSQLSDKAKKELRAYAVSFEYARTQRRRSY